MAREHILVVDDEESILELIRYNLNRNGYETSCASTGEEALRLARSKAPSLILLDLMLPGMDGLDVCRILKHDPKTSHIPVLILTAKGEETDIVVGLELGADDYMTKPFSPKVLLARVKAALRRRTQETTPENAPLRIEDILIHPGRHEVTVNGDPVELTHTELKLLHMLARRPGWVFTRNQIIDEIRGEEYAITDRSVDVLVAGLRKKLGSRGSLIETVRGVGYRFKE